MVQEISSKAYKNCLPSAKEAKAKAMVPDMYSGQHGTTNPNKRVQESSNGGKKEENNVWGVFKNRQNFIDMHFN